jgi:hypothetical protein
MDDLEEYFPDLHGELTRKQKKNRDPNRARPEGYYTLSPTDYVMFEPLIRIGPAPSSYLHAVKELKLGLTSESTTKVRLTQLFHDRSRRYDARLLDRRPETRGRSMIAQSVYEILPMGVTAFEEYTETLITHRPPRSNSFLHDFMVSVSCWSLYLSMMKNGDRFIFHDEVVDKLGKSYYQVDGAEIHPDYLTGVEYANGKALYIAVEGDGGSHRVSTTGKSRRKDLQTTFLNYARYIRTGKYKEDYGEGTSLVVVFLFNRFDRMKGAMKIAEEMFDTPPRWLLFRFIPGLRSPRDMIPPYPMYKLYTEPFPRAGLPPFNLMNP